MMHRTGRLSRQRGISMVLIVILVVVTIILAASALLTYAHKVEKEQIQKAMEKEVGRLQEEIDLVSQTRVPKNEATGVAMAGETLNETKANQINAAKRKKHLIDPVNELLKDPKINSLFTEKLRQDGLPEKSFEEVARNMPLYDKLQNIVPILNRNMIARRITFKRLEVEREIWRERAKQATDLSPQYRKTREDSEAVLNQLIAEIRTRIETEQAAFDTRSGELEDAYNKAKTEIETLDVDFEQWKIRMKNDLGELQRRLDELKVKETIKHEYSVSHGKLLEPDIPNHTAFIDLGSRERVQAGMKFLVAKRGKKGEFHFKGEIEVKKVWMTYSEVSITSLDDRESPMVDGDMLVNPLYNPRRSMIVAFVGRDEIRGGKFPTVTEASNRMTEMGVTVRDEIGLDVDFVIFTGKPSADFDMNTDKKYQKTVLLEIPMAPSSDIFRFIGD